MLKSLVEYRLLPGERERGSDWGVPLRFTERLVVTSLVSVCSYTAKYCDYTYPKLTEKHFTLCTSEFHVGHVISCSLSKRGLSIKMW